MNVTSSADTELWYGLGFGLFLPLILAAAGGATLCWWSRRCWWQQRWHLPRKQPVPKRIVPAEKSTILHIVQNPQHLALSAEAIRLTEELQAARQASLNAQRTAATGTSAQQVMVVKRTFAPITPSR